MTAAVRLNGFLSTTSPAAAGASAAAAAQEEDGGPERDRGHRPEGQEQRPDEGREEDRGQDDDPDAHHRPGEEQPPGERVVGLPPSSRLCFAKASVTAVEETRPPESPVTAVPRCGPSARVAT